MEGERESLGMRVVAKVLGRLHTEMNYSILSLCRLQGVCMWKDCVI